MRALLALLLLLPLAYAEDDKPDAPPGQAVAAEHKASPQADAMVETELAKQATKAHAEYWAIVNDNAKAGLTHFGQKDLATNPRAKKEVEAQHRYISLQHEALVEFFSIADRRTQMPTRPDSVKRPEDQDALAFNKAVLTYPWEIGDKEQAPRTAGMMYGRRHGIAWLTALCGADNKR